MKNNVIEKTKILQFLYVVFNVSTRVLVTSNQNKIKSPSVSFGASDNCLAMSRGNYLLGLLNRIKLDYTIQIVLVVTSITLIRGDVVLKVMKASINELSQ